MNPDHLLIAIVAVAFAASPLPLLLQRFGRKISAIGAAFALLGSVGLARLPDFFTRLHGPTKATTLGVGAMVLASAVYFSYPERGEPARDRGDAVPVHHRAGVRAPAVQGGAAPGQG